MLERFTSAKHSNLFGQFISYEENEVLWIRTMEPTKEWLLAKLYFKTALLALPANIRQ